ncbi:DUF2946 family protein [Hydrogenophaga sp. MI9]|uniref:DUF2946 family protein n=1 Tax=Hydrogenophaga sp. MI9 TaxID=3453719 RepID=UPI003EEE39DA
MRRWFVLFLIVLLPWRAWAGDAMTLTAPAAPAAPATAVAHCADHAMQAAPQSLADHDNDPAQADGAVPHAVCDICNGPALAAAPLLPVAQHPLPPARQSTGPVRFASALPRAGHKPPIA